MRPVGIHDEMIRLGQLLQLAGLVDKQILGASFPLPPQRAELGKLAQELRDMIDAAKAIGSSVAQTSMSVMLGNAWNDLVQPFWILPALALSKLKLKDVMGYTVIMMFWVGAIYIVSLLAWGMLTH